MRCAITLLQAGLGASFAFMLASTATAGEIEPKEYDWLKEEIVTKKFARVMATLGTYSLSELSSRADEISDYTESTAQKLLADLGDNVIPGSAYNNGIGQFFISVNQEGLDQLTLSSDVVSVVRDSAHPLRVKPASMDGSIEEIEDLFINNEILELDMILNVDRLSFDIAQDGETYYYPLPGLEQQIDETLANILSENYSDGIVINHVDHTSPVVRASVDRSAFYGLIESEHLRGIKYRDFEDKRIAKWPLEELNRAATQDATQVSIALRGGEFFTTKTGYTTEAAIDMQYDASVRAFNSIFADAGIVGVQAENYQDLLLGSFTTEMTYDQLQKLYDGADDRILAINYNIPATVHLNTSTTQINANYAWSSGLRGAGQNMVVIDTGVRKSHVYFEDASAPYTRVLDEACFGTNGTLNGVLYSSPCPNPGFTGDSPINEPGAGEPYGNPATCSILVGSCAHGSHVAGITAGKTLPPYTLVQGVAPDANIVAVQAASWSDSPADMTFFTHDLSVALSNVWGVTVTGTGNPFTVNMSLGGGLYSSDCYSFHTTISSAVQNLLSRGVPVVVSTGNDGARNGIAWPACVPEAVKVSGVENDLLGTTMYADGNFGDPANYTGPFFLAPSGGGGTFVWSASDGSDTSIIGMAGTSQAAPHIAGVYALLKEAIPGVTVADASSWITSTGSLPITLNLGSPNGNVTFRRLKLP